MTTALLSTRAEAEARAISIRAELDKMDEIAERLGPLVAEAKDREDWRALGYRSWDMYVREKLGISRRRSYQLLDQVRVERALSGAVGAPVAVPERAAREVKGSMSEIMAQAERNVASGMAPQSAADEAVRFVRQRVAVERSYEDLSDSQDEVPAREQRSDELTTLVETARAVLPYVNDGAAEWALRSALEPFA